MEMFISAEGCVSVIPVGINYNSLAEYNPDVSGCVSRETGPKSCIACLWKFGVDLPFQLRNAGSSVAFIRNLGSVSRSSSKMMMVGPSDFGLLWSHLFVTHHSL
jgi:hypothetical protein